MRFASNALNPLRLFLLVLLLTVSAAAQTVAIPSRIKGEVDETSRHLLVRTTPLAIKGAHDLGSMEGTHSFNRMVLLLKPSLDQQASLNSLVDSLHNRNSPNYHKWLKPEEFAAKFGPSDDDVAKVMGWLESHGLTPTAVGKGRQWIEFSGAAQQVNDAFATSMHRYEVKGQTHIANASDLSIPQALAPVVAGVLSLNDFRTQPAHSKPVTLKRNTQGKLVPINSNFTSTDGNGNYFYKLAPADFQTIYNSSPLLKSGNDGAGISIAIAGRSDISLADVQSFRQTFGLAQNDPNIIINGVDPGITPPGEDLVESTLDVEWAGASAPGSTINLVESASTDTTDGIDLSSAYIVDNAVSPIVSVSYGTCEALLGPSENQFYSSLWEQAAAEGLTVFVSTGDGGAAQCDADLQNNNLEPQGPALNGPSINGLSSTPFNVAVGGTQFNEAGNSSTYWSLNNSNLFETALGYIPEQAWNESCDPTLPQTGTNCINGQTYYVLEGAGGGPSNCSQESVDNHGNVTCIAGYPKPSWQAGIGVPSDAVRDTPDLALNASPDDEGYLLCVEGSCQVSTVNGQPVLEQASIIGGTSASAPSMAGIMALVEQKNGAYQGQANYVFYKLAAMDTLTSCNSSLMTAPGQPSTCVFNDITLGSNSDPGLPGYATATADWTAGVGYDLTTGLGTVNAANMVAQWGNVSFAASTTTLSATGTSVAHGQPLTIKISVAPSSGTSTPTGDVALVTDKYGAVGQVTLDATGNYSGSVSNLPGGTYNLTARYAGDGNFASSTSAPVSLTVAGEASAVAFHLDIVNPLTNGPAPYTGSLQYENPFYVAVTVAGKSGQGLPTGTVNLLNGTSVVLSAPLTSSGTAFIPTGSTSAYTFPVGTSSLTVQYSGDNSFSPSTSAPQSVTVQKQQVSTGVGIGFYQIVAGQPVTFTASIQPQYGSTIPTGTFQFYDNGHALGSPIPIVSNGLAYALVSYRATLTVLGQHNITAGYSGDGNFTAVSGTDPNYAYASQFTIVPAAGAATKTAIVQTPTTVSFGQSFSYIVTVAPVKSGGPAPTGQVLISSNNNTIFGLANLVNGKATIVEQTNPVSAKVFAQYQGDSNYAASTSSSITTTVTKYTPAVSLTSTAPYVLPGQQTSLNMVVGGFSYGQYGSLNATGTIQFFTSVNGGALQAITPPSIMLPVQAPPTVGLSARATLPTGTNVVTAVYSGDQDFNGVTSSPLTIIVSNPDFTVSPSPSALTISAGGTTTDALTVTPILGFTGAVSLSCGSGLPAGTTCNFSPATIPNGAGSSTLTISMQGPFSPQAANKPGQWSATTTTFSIAGLCLLGFAGRRRKSFIALLVVFGVFSFLSGCGGSGTPSSTLVIVESSASKVASGASVTFSAKVSGGSGSPQGMVTFYDGATALGGAATLVNGQASLALNNLPIGTHSITAKYSGDSGHAGSTSQPYFEAITGVATVQVVATSGSTSHTLPISITVQ